MCTISSKIPFNLKGGRFCRENLLRYLYICYDNSAYHKLKTFPQLKALSRSESSRKCFCKIDALRGKGYFALQLVNTFLYTSFSLLPVQVNVTFVQRLNSLSVLIKNTTWFLVDFRSHWGINVFLCWHQRYIEQKNFEQSRSKSVHFILEKSSWKSNLLCEN